MTTALELEGVVKRFGDKTAVDGLSLTVPAGTIFGVLGPNGAGKTTTLRLIMSIRSPDAGRVLLFGEPFHEGLKDRIGYMPEERGLYVKMRVGRLLEFLARIKNVPRAIARERIVSWMERFGLGDRIKSRLEDFSKGMQQKVQMIATLLHDPDLIILDEPFSGLDPLNTDLFREILEELRDKGKTILFSTHVLEQAEKMCDSLVLIDNGKAVVSGRMHEVLSAHGEDTVHLTFDGEAPDLSGHRDVEKSSRDGNRSEITLREGMDPRPFVKSLLDEHALTRFEVSAPSLGEVFRLLVGRREPEATS